MGRSRAVSMRRLAAVGLSTAAAVGMAVVATAPASAAPEGVILGTDSATAIDGSYLVVYEDGATAEAKASAAALGAKVTQRYSAALTGFAAQISEQQARRFAADPDVAFVQQNQVLSLLTDQPNPPSWGLDRIDQRDLPLNSDYLYATTASNVHAYIIDTGMDLDHPDYGGRASSGFDAIDGGAADDCHGHGSHVGGTVGGTAHGVAKGVSLVAVRVLNCAGSGTTAQVVAGIDWVTANAVKPATANMSLGGSADAVLDAAVQASIAAGITYGVASGNSNTNACTASPARVPEAITVNATTRTDARASFSNFGPCTDIFAPGEGITSDWLAGGTNTISGTSMATPHVVGVSALYLSAHPEATPQQVRDALVAVGTPGKVTSPGAGSPNVLLYTGDGGDPTPPPGCEAKNNTTPVAIPDAGAAVTSTIEITACEGKASYATTANVRITHPYRGDLVIDLVAPDGTTYRLKNASTTDGADNVNQTYTVNAATKPANGVWTLKVRDLYRVDSGTLTSWTLDV
jgi:subtilisin family serine protease